MVLWRKVGGMPGSREGAGQRAFVVSGAYTSSLNVPASGPLQSAPSMLEARPSAPSVVNVDGDLPEIGSLRENSS